MPREMRPLMTRFTSLPIQQLPVGSILRAPIIESGDTNTKLLAGAQKSLRLSSKN